MSVFLCSLCHSVVLPDTLSYEERDENQRESSLGCRVGDKTLPIENAEGASLLQLQCVAVVVVVDFGFYDALNISDN